MANDHADAARYHTLRTLRKHPDLPKWFSDGRGNDTSHAEIIKKWLQAVTPYLSHGRDSQFEERAEALLEWGSDYLTFNQAAQLAATWTNVRTGDIWPKLTPAAQWLYRLIHAIAQENDQMGGASVLISQRVALRGIEFLGGRRDNGKKYTGLGTITTAREELAEHALVHVEVGREWAKGVKSRPTRYTLPCDPATPLNYPLCGSRDSSVGQVEPVPRLTPEQRESLVQVFDALKSRRSGQSEPAGPSVASEVDISAAPAVECFEPDWLLSSPPAKPVSGVVDAHALGVWQQLYAALCED